MKEGENKILKFSCNLQLFYVTIESEVINMESLTGADKLRETIRILERKLGVLDDIQATCCGVTFAQCHAMVEIGRAQNLSLNDLADILGLDKSTMSRTINNLVSSNLVQREIDPSDRRYVTIRLTEQGLQSYQEIETGMNIYFTQIYNTIPENKRDQVIESLHLLLQALAENDCCKSCQNGSQPPFEKPL